MNRSKISQITDLTEEIRNQHAIQKGGSMLPTSFRPEGSTLPVALLPHFERFYRDQLRHVVGTRIAARALHNAFVVWSADEGLAPLTFSALRQQMEIAGHRRVQSNGVFYVNVGFARAFPDLADTLPLPFRGRELVDASAEARRQLSSETVLLGKVDAALASLLDLRRALVAADDQRAPHEAAERVLGLFGGQEG